MRAGICGFVEPNQVQQITPDLLRLVRNLVRDLDSKRATWDRRSKETVVLAAEERANTARRKAADLGARRDRAQHPDRVRRASGARPRARKTQPPVRRGRADRLSRRGLEGDGSRQVDRELHHDYEPAAVDSTVARGLPPEALRVQAHDRPPPRHRPRSHERRGARRGTALPASATPAAAPPSDRRAPRSGGPGGHRSAGCRGKRRRRASAAARTRRLRLATWIARYAREKCRGVTAR